MYFFQSVDGGPVKIGYTIDLESRWKALENLYGCKLALLATMPGGRPEEAEIHARFADIRLEGSKRRGGRPEQFRPTAELMAFIGKPLLVGVNPAAVEAMETPMHSLVSLKGTDEFEAWIDGLVEHTHQGTRTLLLRNALREFAEKHKYGESQPKR